MKKLFLCLLLLCFVGGCGSGAFLIQPVPKPRSLLESQVSGDQGLFLKDKIAIIEIDGLIVNGSKSGLLGGGENPMSVFMEKLNVAKNDPDVKAVVLRINSPGGTVTASNMMYHALTEFKAKTKKPVVACMLDVAASGGYYIAAGCDGIVAGPSTVTGSIGTIMQTVSFAGTMEKIGVKAVAIKSGKLKDVGSPLRDLSEDEREVLQDMITKFFEQFLDVILKGRKNITEEKLRQLADGRVYIGTDAKENGLVDRIGYPADAVKWAKKLAGLEKARVVIYHRPYDYMPHMYGSAMNQSSLAQALININIPGFSNTPGCQFLYLWSPGN